MDSPATKEHRPLLNRRHNQNSRQEYEGLSSHSLVGVPTDDGEILQMSVEHPTPKRWPWFIWLLLKIIGLYNNRRIVTRRRCHSCRLTVRQRRFQARGEETSLRYVYLEAMEGEGGYDQDRENTNDESHQLVDVNLNRTVGEYGRGMPGDDDCMVCRSEWWDARGRYRPYSETDIGARKWNHCGSIVLSFIWPLTLIGLVVYDSFSYFRVYWGKKKQLIRLMSYSTYLLFIASSPFFSLVANFYEVVADRRGTGQRSGFSWYEARSVQYIVKGLQHLELGERGLPYKAYLALCLLWPCLNGAYRVVIYYALVHHSIADIHIEIILAAGLVCMIVFGAFCYLILLMRLSFQRQLRLELAFLLQHEGALSVCRRRLAVYAEQLGSMCRLVSIWITFVLAVSTWAFTAHICGEKFVISKNTKLIYPLVELNVDIMILSENTTFLVLPLMAVGGLDLNGVWARFKRRVSQMRSEVHEAFWDKTLAFCEEQSPVYKVGMVTLVFSALGLFLGLNFGYQSVGYWPKKFANTILQPSATPEVFSPS